MPRARRGATKTQSSFFFVYHKKTCWQIESREPAVGLVVEDGVRGSDVFACLHVSQL